MGRLLEPAAAAVKGMESRRVCSVRLPGWSAVPRLGVVMPGEGEPGWADAAWWAIQLEAWGYPAAHLSSAHDVTTGPFTTLVAAAEGLADADIELLARHLGSGTSLVLAGLPSPAAARLLGLGPASRAVGGRLRIDDDDLRIAAGACVPGPEDDGCVVLDAPGAVGGLGPDWTVLASWVGGCPAVAVRPAAAGTHPATLAWFGVPVASLDQRATETVVLLAEAMLDRAAPAGLVGLGRWPGGAPAVLVIDGDVDAPSGARPTDAEYVAAALDTATRAGCPAYSLFVAGAAVDAEPALFPPGPGYHNGAHGRSDPGVPSVSWDALDPDAMTDEVRRCGAAIARHLGHGDGGIFRPPGALPGALPDVAAGHAGEVLERLGYRAVSSLAANVAVTGGLPYHPARRRWGDRPADAAPARSHPDPGERLALLELPISSDPMEPDRPGGFRSGSVLGGSVRQRTCAAEVLEILLDNVLERGVARRGLAHLRLDPRDVGCGRLAGDPIDYAGAVERWLRRSVCRADLAVLTTSDLATWWLEREATLGRIIVRVEAGDLLVEVADPPPGTTLAILEPANAGAGRRRRRVMLDPDPGDGARVAQRGPGSGPGRDGP